jgi:hypothetical protein
VWSATLAKSEAQKGEKSCVTGASSITRSAMCGVPLLIHPPTYTLSMAPLSDKAKGKQRATEPPSLPAGSSQPSAPPAPRNLIIRFTDGEPDLSLQLPANAIGRDVKRMVCTTSYSYANIITR